MFVQAIGDLEAIGDPEAIGDSGDWTLVSVMIPITHYCVGKSKEVKGYATTARDWGNGQVQCAAMDLACRLAGHYKGVAQPNLWLKKVVPRQYIPWLNIGIYGLQHYWRAKEMKSASGALRERCCIAIRLMSKVLVIGIVIGHWE